MADEVRSIADYMSGLQILEHAYRYVGRRFNSITLDSLQILSRATRDVLDAIAATMRGGK